MSVDTPTKQVVSLNERVVNLVPSAPLMLVSFIDCFVQHFDAGAGTTASKNYAVR
jgi:hypothetical protein